MEVFLKLVFLISFVGISYYSIWLLILVLNSIHQQSISDDPKKLEDMRMIILMPMLNEKNVVNQTLMGFLNNTVGLPINLLVIDDGSEDQTAKEVKKFIESKKCNNKIELIQRYFPNAQTGKGDALNYGLNFIRRSNKVPESHVIIGILDADAVMHKNDYKKVIDQFETDSKLDLLQIKVRMLNTNNWLQIMQDIEFATINDWIQRVRNRLHNAAASGNGQFIRLSSMDTKPWGNALLEDFEFSTKFLLDGKKTRYRSDIVVYQEAIGKLRPFIRQRSRWVQGGLDCIAKYLKKIVKSNQLRFWAKFEMIFFMVLPFLTIIVGFSNMVVLIYALIHIHQFYELFIFLTIIDMLLSYYMGIKYILNEGKVTIKTVLTCAGMTIYNIILYPAIVIAFYRKLTNQSYWIKTTHGITQ